MERWFHVQSKGDAPAWGFAIDSETQQITKVNDAYKELKNKSARDLNVRAFFYDKEVVEIKVEPPTNESYG